MKHACENFAHLYTTLRKYCPKISWRTEAAIGFNAQNQKTLLLNIHRQILEFQAKSCMQL